MPLIHNSLTNRHNPIAQHMVWWHWQSSSLDCLRLTDARLISITSSSCRFDELVQGFFGVCKSLSASMHLGFGAIFSVEVLVTKLLSYQSYYCLPSQTTIFLCPVIWKIWCSLRRASPVSGELYTPYYIQREFEEHAFIIFSADNDFIPSLFLSHKVRQK